MEIIDRLKLIVSHLDKEYKKDEVLKKHTTIRIGGKASLFWVARRSADLIKIIRLVQKYHIPYLIVGWGSNIVVTDQGFEGLVIKNECAETVFEKNEAIVDTGINLNHLIRILAESNLGGLEFLSGIPGTLGGAIYGNAGAFGKSISDITKGVIILDNDGEIKKIDAQDLKFSYRSSILKEKSKVDKFSSPIILSARIKLHPASKEGILRVVQNYIHMRVKKQPKKSSCGSVFKNIISRDHPHLPKAVKLAEIEGKIPAGFLLERVGAKGLRYGGAMVSREHANFIVNKGRAKAKDIKILVEECKRRVKKMFGVELEEEIEFIGQIDLAEKGLFGKIFGR